MAGDQRKRRQQVLLEWPARVPVLRNRNLWFNVCIGFGIPSIVIGSFFGWGDSLVTGLKFSAGFLVFFLMLFVVIGGVIDLLGGFRVLFRLTDAGVESLAGKASSRAGRIASVGGFLAGSMGAVGAGLAAREEAHVFISWDEVQSTKVNERTGYVLVKAGFFSKPIGLYCTPENFQQVLKIVQERTSANQATA